MTNAELLVLRQTQLAEMQGGVEEVAKGDKRVKYRRISELREEIQSIKADIALDNGTVKLRTQARTGGSRWL